MSWFNNPNLGGEGCSHKDKLDPRFLVGEAGVCFTFEQNETMFKKGENLRTTPIDLVFFQTV